LPGMAGPSDEFFLTRRGAYMRFTLVPVPTGADDPDQAATLAALARAAEERGFHAFGLSEHPAPSAKWLAAGGHESFDPLVALGYCAAVTKRIRLMPLLSVLPYRNPLHLAKSVASLDVLSGGRLTLVAGAGYLRSEFLALGVDFEQRNELMDESLAVLTQLWTAETFEYTGLHFRAVGQVSRPVPIQLPHPPIWIGGNSLRARQRAVTTANGWSPIQIDGAGAGSARTARIETVDDVRGAVQEMSELLRRGGRDPACFAIQLEATATSFAHDKLSMAARLDEVRELSEAGITDCVVHMPHESAAASLALIREIGQKLIDPLNGAM
jgi:probable F420-dependent oxidoreductase